MASSVDVAAPGGMRSRELDLSTLRERRFFSGVAIALAVAVFVGFSPTFYLRSISGATNTLTPSLIAHGLAFSGWIVLLVLQTSLIAARRTALHRSLGYVGAAFALAPTAVTAYVLVDRTRLGLFLPPEGTTLQAWLTVPFATLVVFPTLLIAAVVSRRAATVHKRLMLIATLELALAGIARWPIVAGWGVIGAFCVTDLFVVAIASYDYVALKRVHPATLWGGLFLIASQPLRLAIGDTGWWTAFADWLLR